MRSFPGFRPLVLVPGEDPVLPDPRGSDREGLVAVGGDLSPERLLFSYERGVFPWYDAGVPPLWWCPDPRCVLPLDGVHVSRSLARTIRRGGFELSWNRAFARVVAGCSDREEGTWILPEMAVAYQDLHRLGAAHSLEVWVGEELVAGLYGVQRGGLFAAESMFTRRSDMSKVALVALCRSLAARGATLLDVQFETEHLARMGAVEITRDEYLDRLEEARDLPVDLADLAPAV